ncbi:MAG: LacI family transcriptional regulator [Planctomycetes bacterium]|nr:LacI family transcriptional regulator [Planctomycetota bacterium]
MARVTIEDISRRTDLSRGTVSRALNDRPDISEQTKQRVMKAVRELNYVPSRAARSLATGRNYAVAVVVDDLHSGLATAFLRGAYRRAQHARYSVHLVELGDSDSESSDRLRNLSAENIDAVLVATPLSGALAGTIREALGERPLASCWELAAIGVDTLIPDQIESGRLSARNILRNGVHDLLYVHARGSVGADQRLNGFTAVCREHGLDANTIVAELQSGQSDHADRFNQLRPHLEHARAVAASDDFLAIQIMLWCQRIGKIPGEDIAIIGQGNEHIGSQIHPTLSTVDLCGEELGQRAMDIVLQRLGKERMDAPQTTRIAPRFLDRETTRCLG